MGADVLGSEIVNIQVFFSRKSSYLCPSLSANMAGTSSKVHMEVEYLVLGRLAVVGE